MELSDEIGISSDLNESWENAMARKSKKKRCDNDHKCPEGCLWVDYSQDAH